MDLWHNVINPTARWINLAFFWNKKICKIEAKHHTKIQILGGFWSFWTNIFVFYQFFDHFGGILIRFLNFFDQKNENLVGFSDFLSILVKYFGILAFFWSFKWILDQFFGIFDEKTEILIRFWAFLSIFLISLRMLWSFWAF